MIKKAELQHAIREFSSLVDELHRTLPASYERGAFLAKLLIALEGVNDGRYSNWDQAANKQGALAFRLNSAYQSTN
jgi:hypothetical protein